MKPHAQLKTYWAHPDSDVVTAPTGEAAVAALELKYDLRLPAEFREYLLQASPVGEVYDQEMTRWWPLDEIKNVPDEYTHPLTSEVVSAEASRYLFFADYMLWCMAWAINCSEDEHRGRIVVFNETERFVADSFSEFVERYTADVWSVL